MKIRLTNTLSKQKETFTPQEEGKVKLYVCGITPYDYSHLGHGRAYVNFDVLVRLLKLLNYKVTYVRNLTDIDDKIIAKAGSEAGINECRNIAEKFTQAYHQDMYQLNCLEPDHEPRVTQYIPEIITFIQGLVEKNHAYVIDGDVYFDVSSFPDYGKLSGRKLDELEAGARVGIDTRKKNPADFALWKGNDQNAFWESPWGFGRPGWHIECSVMANTLLGPTLDIHAGGMDLTFPHHENEIAQSESLSGKPFANYWTHNAFININKEKMSKSLGNFLTLKDTFKTIDPMILRYFLLQHQFKTPIDFNQDDVLAAGTAYKKLVSKFEVVQKLDTSLGHVLEQITSHEATHAMLEALCDDLNTPKFLGIVFETIKTTKPDQPVMRLIKHLMHHVLGLTLEKIEEETVEITPEIQTLMDQREQARAEKNWARADQIRDQLTQMGVSLQDKKL